MYEILFIQIWINYLKMHLNIILSSPTEVVVENNQIRKHSRHWPVPECLKLTFLYGESDVWCQKNLVNGGRYICVWWHILSCRYGSVEYSCPEWQSQLRFEVTNVLETTLKYDETCICALCMFIVHKRV